MRTFALLVIGMTSAACSTQPLRPSEARPGEVISFGDQTPGSVPITVTRDSGYVGSGCSMEVQIEGEPAATLWSGQTVTLYVPAGEVIVAARPRSPCNLGQSGGGLREIEVNARPERPLFFRAGYDMNQQITFGRTGLR
jgi:hypothetical protein